MIAQLNKNKNNLSFLKSELLINFFLNKSQFNVSECTIIFLLILIIYKI